MSATEDQLKEQSTRLRDVIDAWLQDEGPQGEYGLENGTMEVDELADHLVNLGWADVNQDQETLALIQEAIDAQSPERHGVLSQDWYNRAGKCLETGV